MTAHTFQIQLEGLISLLAHNLYADPDVFLREMLQNAHDSIVKRRLIAEAGAPAAAAAGVAQARTILPRSAFAEGRPRAGREPPLPGDAQRSANEIHAPGRSTPARPPAGAHGGPGGPGEIVIALDPGARTLTIRDDGCGLTEAEMHRYLATIGRSGTDELRRRIRATDRARTVELIGQFGIGLLSAFIVADQVDITTRAAGGEGLCWTSRGDAGYTVERAHRDEVGSTVVLHLARDHTRYLDRERVARIIRKYADFLGIPVRFQDADEPINAVDAPWHRDWRAAGERAEIGGRDAGASDGSDAERARRGAHERYWAHRFRDERALAICPIDEAFAFEPAGDSGGDGGGRVVARVRGVLGITDQHIADPGARAAVDLYVSRMFICSDNRDVLPPWARFVRGVIECDALTLNAARDSPVRNAALHALQRRLGERVIAWLTELSASDRPRFHEIMRWHGHHVLQMAVQDEHEALFRAVADLVPLDTNRGPMTIPDYVSAAARGEPGDRDGEAGRAIDVYFIAERGATNQYHMLCSARGLRVFDCAAPHAERFLARYAATWPERIRPVRLDVSGSDVIFEPVSADERARLAPIERAYAAIFGEMGDLAGERRGSLAEVPCVARIDRFRPVEVPALLTESSSAKARRDMEEVTADLDLPAFLRDAVADFVSHERDPLTLHLNADNAVLAVLARRLAAAESAVEPAGQPASAADDPVIRHALVALYNNALMLSARAIPPGDVRAMFQESNRVIELLVDLSERLDRAERALLALRTTPESQE